MFSNDQICTIANLLPSRHLHFGTGLKMFCKSDFSSCVSYAELNLVPAECSSLHDIDLNGTLEIVHTRTDLTT